MGGFIFLGDVGPKLLKLSLLLIVVQSLEQGCKHRLDDSWLEELRLGVHDGDGGSLVPCSDSSSN